MADENENKEGTGKHGHKDTQEPWPHRQEEEQQQQAQPGQEQGSPEEESLEAREYRDEEGDIHHHTKTSMDQNESEEGGENR